MKNSISILILLFVSISISAQEVQKIEPENKADISKMEEFQKLMEKQKVVEETAGNLANSVEIPTAKIKNEELYTILEAPINKNIDYKMLNTFDVTPFKKFELVQPNLPKK